MILSLLGGGITGDVQINDVCLHHKFKKVYRQKEQTKMLEKLKINPKQIPSLDRQEMIDMTLETMAELGTAGSLDMSKAFKSLFITNKMDGSEDFLINDKLNIC